MCMLFPITDVFCYHCLFLSCGAVFPLCFAIFSCQLLVPLRAYLWEFEVVSSREDFHVLLQSG